MLMTGAIAAVVQGDALWPGYWAKRKPVAALVPRSDPGLVDRSNK
jgi:hypothetical protein